MRTITIMTTRSGPISGLIFSCTQALSGPGARYTAVFRTRFHRKQDCRSAELGRVGRLMQPARQVGAETSLGRPHKTSFYSIMGISTSTRRCGTINILIQLGPSLQPRYDF